MKEEIREKLEAAGVLPPKPDPTRISPEMQEFMSSLIEKAIAAAKAPNPLEEKKMREQLALEERKARMVLELGKAEEEAARRKKMGCSHSRWPMSHGKMGGHSSPKGQGEWCTGGQMHGDGTATMVCTRCSWTWHWTPTPQEREYIEQTGMMGMTPPEESRLIKEEAAV